MSEMATQEYGMSIFEFLEDGQGRAMIYIPAKLLGMMKPEEIA